MAAAGASDPTPAPAPPPRHRRLVGLVVVFTVALFASLVGWNKAATADPGLRFSKPAVFRSGSGEEPVIRQSEYRLGREVEVDASRAARFTVVPRLTNGGQAT